MSEYVHIKHTGISLQVCVRDSKAQHCPHKVECPWDLYVYILYNFQTNDNKCYYIIEFLQVANASFRCVQS